MRHGKKINHLGRTSAHRVALLSNLASSLVLSKNKRIITTLAKAKALRVYIEPLINRSKEDSTHSRRVVFGYLQNKEAVTELFREVATKIAQRPGGYTRILKTGFRKGDNADMCLIELVDYNENLLATKLDKKVKTTRRSRGTKKATDTTEGVVAEKTTSKKANTKEVDAELETKVEDTVVNDVKAEEKEEENTDAAETENKE
ncbi:MAG: 50S ribosomal protein L17 [Bacteroidetes bacterium]|nr:50S ribosomal protein L17 [Bacteroidota bacterium]